MTVKVAHVRPSHSRMMLVRAYTDMPFGLLREIFRKLRASKAIITFAFDHLTVFVQTCAALNGAFGRIGMAALAREEYNASLTQPGGLEFLIQRRMRGALLNTATYFTPFFMTPRSDGGIGARGSNPAYWLLHLSAHPLARDVMTRLYWERHMRGRPIRERQRRQHVEHV